MCVGFFYYFFPTYAALTCLCHVYLFNFTYQLGFLLKEIEKSTDRIRNPEDINTQAHMAGEIKKRLTI